MYVFLNKWSRAPREAEKKYVDTKWRLRLENDIENVQQTYLFCIKIILDTCSTV